MHYTTLIRTKLLTVLLLLLYTTGNFAQKPVDSVRFYLAKCGEPNGNSRLYYLQKAMENAQNIYDSIYILREKVIAYTHVGEQEKAYRELSRIISIKEDKDLCKTLDALIVKDLAYYWFYFNQYDQAYDALLKSKNITDKLDTEDIELYNKKFHRHITKNLILSDIVYNLGSIALDMQKPDKAELYYKQFMQILGDSAKEGDIIDAKINLYSLLSLKGKHHESIQSYLQLIKEYDLQPIDLSLSYYNISYAYEKLKDYKKALSYVDKSIQISEGISDRVQLIDLYCSKAELLHNLKDYEHEKVFLQKALVINHSIDDKQTQKKLYRSIAENELSLKHPEKAIVWFEKLNKLRDSMEHKNNNIQLHNVELENQLVKQEQKSARQHYIIQESRKRIHLYIWIIILSITLLIFMYFYWYSSKINQKKQIQLAEHKIRIQNIEAENERKIMELEQKRIHDDLSSKNKELLVKVIQHKKRKEKLKLFLGEIDKIKAQSIIKKEHLEKLKKNLEKHSYDLDKSEDIQQQLMSTHKHFFNKLLQDYPNLSKTELKVLAFLRIGLSTKEIADIQYVSIDAVRKTRHRIRKKLGLDVHESLEKFILHY